MSYLLWSDIQWNADPHLRNRKFYRIPRVLSRGGRGPTPEKLVARFRNKPLEFQPGEKWKYSNSGDVLLGYLIEKISGQTYSQFVLENIFKPLEMQGSGLDVDGTPVFNRHICGDERKKADIRDRQREHRRRFASQKCPHCGRNRLDRERLPISEFRYWTS